MRCTFTETTVESDQACATIRFGTFCPAEPATEPHYAADVCAGCDYLRFTD